MNWTKLIAGLSIAVGNVAAWGATGHQAVGYVAMPFLAPRALSFVQSTLGTTFNNSLGPAATWADEIKSNSSYAWASSLHYVDALDNPPSSCSVNQTRDCQGGCILSAITNYTTRVVQTSLSTTQRREALLFLDHFIGDIGQPLHVENFEQGGNGVSVRCNGATSNLHSVWDSLLVNRLVAANYSGSAQTWATALVNRIRTGSFNSSAPSWISCSSTSASAGCVLTWARDSNAIDCSHVFNYPDFSDLCTSAYYTSAVPLIEAQIAKQGFRLAAWLNVLFDGSTNLL